MVGGRLLRMHSSRLRRVLPGVFGIFIGLTLVAGVLVVPVQHPTTGRTPGPPSPTQAVYDPEFLPKVINSTQPIPDEGFGGSVAISGSTVVIGAPEQKGYNLTDAQFVFGCVYIDHTATGKVRQVCGSDFLSTGNFAFGFSVAIGDGLVAVGDPNYAYHTSGPTIFGAGAVFVYRASTGHLVSTLTSPDPTYDGQFGRSVSISGNQLAIGAPYENESYLLPDVGHAYVLTLPNGPMTMLSDPYYQDAAAFGLSVSISGNRVLVGAAFQTTGFLFHNGVADLFAASTGDVIESLIGPAPANDAEFGSSVAINGTVAVVGAPASYTDAPGSAYIFNLQTSTNLTLSSPAPLPGGWFGYAVSITPSWVVVGAPSETSGGSLSAGNAYLFGSLDGELASSVFQAPDWPANGIFGASVALSSTQVVVGAPGAPMGNMVDAGLAYLFSTIPVNYSSPNPQSRGYFGTAVSIYNGILAIGASNETVGPYASAGRVYLSTSEAGPMLTLTSPHPTAGGVFGSSVSLSSSVLAVGAPGEGGGRVYLFNPSTGVTFPYYLLAGGPDFGASVAVSGDLVAIGAPRTASAASFGSGEAYVFNTTSELWTNVPNPAPAADAYFGQSVAIEGNVLVVGAYGAGDFNGSAYVFNANTGVRFLTLTDPIAGQVGFFGLAVAISGTSVFVGAPNDQGGPVAGGHVLVFSWLTGALVTTLTAPGSISGQFGYSLAANGGTLVVGDISSTAWGVPYAGNVFLFSVSNYAVLDRYNSPSPQVDGAFGFVVAIGLGGKILVGMASLQLDTTSPGNAFLFFL